VLQVLLLLLMVVGSKCDIQLLISEHLTIVRYFVYLGLAPLVPLSLDETHSLIPPPLCPHPNPSSAANPSSNPSTNPSPYDCDERGFVTRLRLAFNASALAPRSRLSMGRVSVWDELRSNLGALKGSQLHVEVSGLVGEFAFDALRLVTSLALANSQIHANFNGSRLFQFGVSQNLSLSNVSLVGFSLPDAPPAELRHCRFRNVSLPCPVPTWFASLCGLVDANATCFRNATGPAGTRSIAPPFPPDLVLAPRDSPLLVEPAWATDSRDGCAGYPVYCANFDVPQSLLARDPDCVAACQLFSCTASAHPSGDRNATAESATFPCRAVLTQQCAYASLGSCAAQVYRPANVTPSAMVDVGFQTMLYTVAVGVSEPFGVGLVTRVELWNVTAGAFVVAFERPHAVRRVREVGVESEVLYVSQPMLTSRARVHFEALLITDVIGTVVLIGSIYPMEPVQPPLVCPPPFSLDSASMIDDTRGDSLCIGALCQEPCALSSGQSAATISFGVAVASPVFLIIDGNATMENSTEAVFLGVTSASTRVYMLDTNASQTFTLVGGVANHVRLAGRPLAGQSLPPPLASSLASRVPGTFVKRRVASADAAIAPVLPCPVELISPRPGATCVWSANRVIFIGGLGSDGAAVARVDMFDRATNRWEAPLTAPFVSSNASAVLCRDAFLFVSVASQVHRLDIAAGEWSVPRWSLSELALNDGEAEPARKLAIVGDELLVVVASFVQPRHDGRRRPLAVGRRVIDTPIDLVMVDAGIVYKGLFTHDFDVDIAALELRQAQNGSFVVQPQTGAELSGVDVFEWRPLPYKLLECSNQTGCNACITDFRNVESCRWCSQLEQCLPRTSACSPSLIDATMCPITTTTTTTTSETTTTTVLMTNATSSAMPSKTSTTRPASVGLETPEPEPASTDVGLIVGLTIGAVALVALAGVAVWCFVVGRSRRASAASRANDDQMSVGRNSIEMSARSNNLGNSVAVPAAEIDDDVVSARTVAASGPWYDAAPAAGGEGDSIEYRAVARGSEVPGYHLDSEDDDDDDED
jgi:hypothetical protein